MVDLMKSLGDSMNFFERRFMMNKRHALLMTAVIFALAAIVASCAFMQTKPTAASFKAPDIALESVQVTQYNGYWYYGGDIKPTKGTAGNNSAVLPLAFVFNITNPNKFPVQLDGFAFTIAFEDFDVNMVNVFETQWIPPGKTNQLAVYSIVDVRQVLLSLLVPNAFKVKEKGTDAWTLLEKWWKGIAEYSVPIHVKGGSAFFVAGEEQKIVAFEAKFPE
jgi:LEA14-like dessication related protein